MYIVAIIALLFIVWFMIAGFRGAVWVPARSNDTKTILQLVDIPPDAHIFEFGCGDGRNLRIVQTLLPSATVTAIEINPVMWLIAKIITRFRVPIKLGDGWRTSVSDYDVIMTFLTPPFMQRFEEKMIAELRPGSLVISYAFELPNLKPIKKQNSYYVYRID